MKPLRLLTCTTLVIAWFAASTVTAQTSIAEQQDDRVIEVLRQNGADVAKIHDIDFFLVFHAKTDAVVTAEKMRILGYEIAGIGQKPGMKEWEIHARRKMVPELQAMQATTRALQSLAESRDGYYDGWGTVGVK